MRVLLIQSYTGLDEAPIYPLGLSYLISHLESHQTELIDLNLSPEPLSEAEKMIRQFEPDVIGISMRNIKVARPGEHVSCVTPHIEAIKRVKNAAPTTPLVCGGTAFSLYAQWFMDHVAEIDLGVFGEGETAFPELLSNLDSPQEVPSVFFRDRNGKTNFTGYGEFPDFGKMPTPDRNIVRVGDYLGDPTSIGVQTKRGCIMKCIHCSDLYLLGKQVRLRDPAHVACEVESLVEEHGVADIMFNDQIFNYPLSHAENICRELIERSIKVRWSAWCDPKYVTKEFLELAKKAGCNHLGVTLEAVADNVLEALKKNFRQSDIIKCTRLLKESRLPVTYNFMINGPGETVFSLVKLVSFILRAKLTLGKRLKLHKLFIDIMRIYPHTELRQFAIKEGIISSDDDLIEPVFYNPAPMKYVVKVITGMISLGWKIKNMVKRFFKAPVSLRN